MFFFAEGGIFRNLSSYSDHNLRSLIDWKAHQFLFLFFQIALAAVIHGASKNGHNLDKYVTEILFVGEKDDVIKEEKLRKIIEAVRNIRVMVKNIDRTEISTVEIKKLFQELEKCRNQDNNPDSQAYKRKIQV